MNLENLSSAGYPFKHWEISSCLDAKTLNEISYSNIPDGDRAYDGTRAADHSGHCLLYTSPSPRDVEESRMPSSA